MIYFPAIRPGSILMKPRFEPNLEPAERRPVPKLIDPEAYDACEQQFAASLEEKPAAHRFVVDDELAADMPQENVEADENPGAASRPTQDFPVCENAPGGRIASPGSHREAAPEATVSTSGNPRPHADPDSWRGEVAARVSHYRARKRPRAPRYPSLQLKFETLDSGAAARPLPNMPDAANIEETVALARPVDRSEAELDAPFVEETPSASVTGPAGNILEFPVFPAPPPVVIDELAEPVLDRPRILEVPEVVPAPPALGGILIEPAEEPAIEKRQGFELPLIAAPFMRRILAAGTDALIVASAFALFAYTFFRMTAVLLPVRQAAGIAAALLAIFWAGYQYLLLVHAGATPGLKLAGLRLSRFDGTDAPRQLRRWRVLASVLSGLSLGLGYAWCFLDEDQLCWHDRITHTYMAPTISSR